MKSIWKQRVIGFYREWVRPLLVVVIVLSTFRSAVADWNDVPTGSMKPTILEGDRILVNKLAYDLKVPFTQWRVARWSEPKRGDVVVLFSPADGTRLVKRVIGIPGDCLEMRNNRLLLNSKPVDYGPLDLDVINQIDPPQQGDHRFATEAIGKKPHPVMTTPNRPAPRSFKPISIPKGKFFVMGDNRDSSADSRMFGLVDSDLIVGRSTMVAISVDPSNYYLPRWDRFFSSLR